MHKQNIWHIAKYRDDKNHPKFVQAAKYCKRSFSRIYNIKPVALFTNSMKAWALKMLAAFGTVVFNLGGVSLFLGVVRASNTNIHIYFSVLYFLWNYFLS